MKSMLKSETLILNSRLSRAQCLNQLAQAITRDKAAARPLYGTIEGEKFNLRVGLLLTVDGKVEESQTNQSSSRIILNFIVPGWLAFSYSGSFAFILGTSLSVLAYGQKSAEGDVFASYWTALTLILLPSLLCLFSGTFLFGTNHASQKKIIQTIISICQCDPVQHNNQKDAISSARKSVMLNAVLHVLPLLAGWFLVPVVIDNLHDKAWQMWIKGEYKNSQAFCRPIVFLSELIDGKSGKKAAYAKYITAECCRCAGELEEANILYNQSLAAQLKHYDKYDPRIAWTYDNLGRVQEKMGEMHLAEQSYNKAVFIWNTDRKNQTPLIARTKDRQALMYIDKMRNTPDKDKPALLKLAKRTMEEAVELDRAIFKDRDASLTVAQDYNDWGVIMYASGDKSEASRFFEEAFAQKNLCKNDISLANTMLNLAFVTNNAELKNKGLNIWRNSLGNYTSGLSNEDLLAHILERTNIEYEYPNCYGRVDKVIPEALK